jgi:hypothetical protein
MWLPEISITFTFRQPLLWAESVALVAIKLNVKMKNAFIELAPNYIFINIFLLYICQRITKNKNNNVKAKNSDASLGGNHEA